MGFFHDMEKDEGMRIIPPEGSPIEIIVRHMGGIDSNHRIADLEIRGITHLNHFHISYHDGLQKITKDIYIGIRDQSRATPSWQVPIHFAVKPDYKLESFKEQKIPKYR